MRKPLPPDELAAFLRRPIVAVLATHRRNGEVLLSPVWHEHGDGGFTIVVDADGAQARNLSRDPRTSLAVFESEPPYAGAEIRTTAVITAEGYGDALRRIAIRYLGEARGNAYADVDPGGGRVVRLEGGSFRSWDFPEYE